MEKITSALVKKLYLPPKDSHKGQNGKLMIIGGSHLFHGASMWALIIASRIVDMVFYSTVEENRQLVMQLKTKLFDFIFVDRNKIGDYLSEADAVLIGPGMTRIKDTYEITKDCLIKFPQKKWIIDAGSLQMIEAESLKRLSQVIITPHIKEFSNLFKLQFSIFNFQFSKLKELVFQKAKEYGCTIVLKGPIDIICSPTQCLINQTGNEGMTKGGTGDVLAGLIAALACKNDLFLAAGVGTYINGLAGDALYKKVGPYYNASDLCAQIPKTLKKLRY